MLLAIYQCGSKVLGLKGKDSDYLYIYETKQECDLEKRLNKNHSVDIHFTYLDKCDRTFLGCYAYSKLKLVEGKEIDKIKSYNFLEHWLEWLEIAKKRVSSFGREDKRWYHILVGIYYHENNAIKLTKEQKANVKEAHDNGINDELYKYIIDYFSKK